MIFAVLALAVFALNGAGEIDLPAYGLSLPITRDLLATLPDERLTGTGDTRSAVLVGDLVGPMHGSVAFLRNAGKWRAVAVAPAASSVGVFRARRSGAVFIWTMPDIEGPGQQFDGLSMSATGGGRFCTRLPFPAALNIPVWQSEFLELAAFNVDSTGAATLIGTADVERDVMPPAGKKKRKATSQRTAVRLIFRYTSRDGGRRWSVPQSIAAQSSQLHGRYDRIEGAPSGLIASLRAQVR